MIGITVFQRAAFFCRELLGLLLFGLPRVRKRFTYLHIYYDIHAAMPLAATLLLVSPVECALSVTLHGLSVWQSSQPIFCVRSHEFDVHSRRRYT